MIRSILIIVIVGFICIIVIECSFGTGIFCNITFLMHYRKFNPKSPTKYFLLGLRIINKKKKEKRIVNK